jgi:hypothetical protein
MSDSTDVPLSLATFDQIRDELARRSEGMITACVVPSTKHEEKIYMDFTRRTTAIGLCERLKHGILHREDTPIPDPDEEEDEPEY